MIFLLIVPLAAAVLSACVKNKIRILEILAIAASGLELAIVLRVVSRVLANGNSVAGSYLYADSLSSIILLSISVIGFAASIYSVGYLREEVAKKIIGFRRVREYYVLLHAFLFAMFAAVTAANPIIMWVAIEATTLSTAFLISFYNKPSAMEAAWKYLMINSVGLLLAFFGTLLFLTATRESASVGFVDWNALLSNAGYLNSAIVKMAFALVLVGYGTKVGLVPMHTWLPDAHGKAPAPISSLLSGVLLNVAFLAIIRFKMITDSAIGVEFARNLLISFGIVSVAVAAFIIFSQKNYKRLLAYSSIEHMGIIALGLGFGVAGTFGALLHLIYHSLTKSALFFSAGNIFLKYSSTKIEKVRGVLSAMPATGIVFFAGFLAISGVPPFGIFITEFYIISAGMFLHPVVTSFALFFLVLVFVGILKRISSMAFGEITPSVESGEINNWTIAAPVILLILLVTLSLYLPEPLKALIFSATAAIK